MFHEKNEEKELSNGNNSAAPVFQRYYHLLKEENLKRWSRTFQMPKFCIRDMIVKIGTFVQ